ncbi:hypothetical protein BOP93_07075 [Pseudomonas orientalis]|uniref:Uncharacterized protein n=1 Tax=Pseudomonas orientalis TaxID=76758 RepID=A0A2L0RTR0_9PSED|nr:hypothetical protein BOP93_07075 [Pseudomonas orientalis]
MKLHLDINLQIVLMRFAYLEKVQKNILNYILEILNALKSLVLHLTLQQILLNNSCMVLRFITI